MKKLESTLITVDGPSKCGSTTVMDSIATEARFQRAFATGANDYQTMVEWGLDHDIALVMANKKEKLSDFSFRHISTLSAGNIFRAVALHHALLELNGISKTEFCEDDRDPILELLTTDGIEDILQNDPNIGKSVSTAAQLPGVQALCGAIFNDKTVEAYQESEGGNLVIIDARDPVGHLMRNGSIASGAIDLRTILPLYVSTTPEVSASRMPGDYEKNLATVRSRRLADAQRAELPVERPRAVIDIYENWVNELVRARAIGEIATPYELDNSSHDLSTMKRFAGHVASFANDIAIRSHHDTASAEKIAAASAQLVAA